MRRRNRGLRKGGKVRERERKKMKKTQKGGKRMQNKTKSSYIIMCEIKRD